MFSLCGEVMRELVECELVVWVCVCVCGKRDENDEEWVIYCV